MGFGKWRAKYAADKNKEYLALGKSKNNDYGDFIKVLSTNRDEDTNEIKVELVENSHQKNEILTDFIRYFENQCY